LVIAGARHTDVLEPAAGPRLMSLHTELLTAQVFRDLLEKKQTKVRGTLCGTWCSDPTWTSASSTGIPKALDHPAHMCLGASGNLVER
jgi:hypothetical protein